MFADAPSLRITLQFLHLVLVFACFAIQVPLRAAQPVLQPFDIPAADAVVSLQLFANQSGRQLLYSGDAVAGTQTVAVRGQFTAREALDRMVSGTRLTVVEDAQTGALAINKSADPSAIPSSLSPPSASPDSMNRKRTLSTLAAFFSFTLATGQSQQTAANSTNDDVVELSPFEVTSARTFGYRAASSVTATGIGTEIANVPVNVGVVTNEFLQDWGGVELRDATKGVSSFSSDSQNTNRAWLRGFESSRILQDGFEIGYGMMTDGIDRIEVIKGPSAIFHGEVNPAGVVNLISSKPTWSPQNELRMSVGDFEHFRTYFQSSGPIIKDKLAYMAFASYTDENGWADHQMREFKVAGGALTWQALPKLKFWLDARYTEKTRIEPVLLPFTHPAFVAAVQAGQVAPLTTARNWLNANPLYGPNEPQSQVLVDHLLFRDHDHNPFNGNYPQLEERQTIQADMTYTHSEAVNFRLAAFDNHGERTNGFYTSFRPVAGYNRDLIFAAAEHRFNYSYNDQERSGLKADLNLNFNLLGMEHAMLVGYEHGERRIGSSSINTPARVYNPRTEPERDAMAELRAANPTWFRPIADYGWLKSDSYYVADQISMFEGKLRVLAGARHMELEVYSPGTTAGSGRIDNQSKTTPQLGGLFRPFKAGAIYVNYSESFESQLVVDALGGVSGPITGDGIEAGIKVDSPDGRLSGTLGVYRIDRANIARRDTVRERELNITPLWIMGGEQRTEGLDLDVTYTPMPNLQFVVTYANMWFAETIADPQTPQQVGVRLRQSPEHSFGLFGKYTFTSGALKNFYFGASYLYRSPFNFHDSWDVPAQVENYRILDLLIGYRRPLKHGRELTIALNLNNVTDVEYLDFQYLWAEPMTWRLTSTFRF